MNDGERAFHQSVIDDPLFAAEGMDIQNARAALSALQTSINAVELEYSADSIWKKLFLARYPLAKYAVPLSFMSSFVTCEEARRRYLASPSRAVAEELLSAWERAAQSMSDDVRRYRKLQRILVRLESSEDTFVMQDSYGYVTSYRHAEKTVRLFEENAHMLREHASGRRRVLHGEHTHMPDSVTHDAPPVPVLVPGEMTPWQNTIRHAAIQNGTWPYRYVDIEEVHGPMRLTVPNFDAVATEHTFLFYTCREKDSGLKSIWVALVDRCNFLDLWNFIPKADSITRGKYATAVGLKKEEMPYWYEPATNLYGSRDSTYWADMWTAVDLVRRPELSLEYLAMQRSSMWDMLLVECARDFRVLVAHLRRRKRSETTAKYSKLYDFMTRSYPGIFYLPFNASVWRLHEKPQLLGERFSAPDASKLLSEEKAKAVLTPAVLATVMSAARLREERGRAEGWLA